MFGGNSSEFPQESNLHDILRKKLCDIKGLGWSTLRTWKTLNHHNLRWKHGSMESWYEYMISYDVSSYRTWNMETWKHHNLKLVLDTSTCAGHIKSLKSIKERRTSTAKLWRTGIILGKTLKSTETIPPFHHIKRLYYAYHSQSSVVASRFTAGFTPRGRSCGRVNGSRSCRSPRRGITFGRRNHWNIKGN